MDVNDNAFDGQPDVGDPVTIPFSPYRMQCDVQPVEVEFAILLPQLGPS